MTPEFKKDDIVQAIDPEGFFQPLRDKLKDRDGVIEWVGPDAHGQFKNKARVRWLKRNGRGKEFTERMDVRDLKLKENP